MEQEKDAVSKARPDAANKAKPDVGGREFGNVIEPTQGQMASGNKGLSGDAGSGSAEASKKKTPEGKESAA